MSVYGARRRRAVGMCDIVDPDDFQGLWEGWETDSLIVGLPGFPSGRHFHRFCRRRARLFIIGAVDFSWVLLIAELLAVGLHLRLVLDLLSRLDQRQSVAEPLVLDNGRVLTRWSFEKIR